MDNHRWIVYATFTSKTNRRIAEPYNLYDSKADAVAAKKECREDLESQGMRNVTVSVKPDILITS